MLDTSPCSEVSLMSLAESNIGHLRSGDYWTTALCNPSCSSENVPSGAGFRVELRHLRHFIGVAKELHFACTAERLETGQHRQATRFRAELGVLVFHQTTRYASNGVSAATSVSIVLRTRKSETTQTHECSRAGVLPTLHGVVFAIFGAGPAVHCRRVAAPRPGRCHSSSDQPHALQARMPVLADDDVVMHGDAERCFVRKSVEIVEDPG